MGFKIDIDTLHPKTEELLTNSELQRKHASRLGVVSIASSAVGAGTLALVGDRPATPDMGTGTYLFDIALRYGPALIALASLTTAGGEFARAAGNRAFAWVIDTDEFTHGSDVSYTSIPEIVRSLPLLPDRMEELITEIGAGLGIQSEVDGATYVITRGKNPKEWILEIGKSGKDIEGTEYGYVSPRYISNRFISAGGNDDIRLANGASYGNFFDYDVITFVGAVMHKRVYSTDIVHPQEYKSRKDFYAQLETLCRAVTAKNEGILSVFSKMMVEFRLIVGSDTIDVDKISQMFHSNIITLSNLDDLYRDGELDTDDAHKVREGIRSLLAEMPLSCLVFVAPNVLKDELSIQEKTVIRDRLKHAHLKMMDDKREWDEHKDDTEIYFETETFPVMEDGKTVMKSHQVMKTRLTARAERCRRELRELAPQLEAVNKMLELVAA